MTTYEFIIAQRNKENLMQTEKKDKREVIMLSRCLLMEAKQPLQHVPNEGVTVAGQGFDWKNVLLCSVLGCSSKRRSREDGPSSRRSRVAPTDGARPTSKHVPQDLPVIATKSALDSVDEENVEKGEDNMPVRSPAETGENGELICASSEDVFEKSSPSNDGSSTPLSVSSTTESFTPALIQFPAKRNGSLPPLKT
eukprot:CAMPEP_0184665552 /NCGR_PEP_ID=MMETSP0308-20130426/57693_1 /TAXON_ID=38269 /ORGANISM="Gloeochaete witrockiana, Strain SAG 46.84" /LENGTH=195 /DNA_ID=CAMNT_0027109629 /DNA_START=663 /DNA_END=1250 /DNA_ORIENTATION=+